MKSKILLTLAVIAMVFAVLSTQGCTTTQDLLDTADQADRLADSAGSLAAEIVEILEDYPADRIEDSTLAEMIRGQIESFNADWLPYWDTAVSTFSNVRTAAIEFVNIIPDLQENLEQRAEDLREQAARNDGEFWNTVGLGLQWGLAIFGSGGILAGVFSTIRAFQGERATASIINAVDAVRLSDGSVDAVFNGRVGAAAKMKLTPRARTLLAKYKSS